MPIIQVDEDNFKQEMDKAFANKHIVILKFETELCDACQALEFELDEIDEANDDVTILTVDCSEAPDLTEHFDVQRVPTMIIYKNNNNTLYAKEGVLLAQDIQEIINKNK